MSLDLGACSDAELASLALGGRQAAYSMLMERHRGAIFRLLRTYTGDADAALDLTQQSFIAAFSALDRYDRTRAFPFWITRIALNKARDWSRRRSVRRFFTFARPLEAAHDIADDVKSIEGSLADRHELARVIAAIAALPPTLKDILVLRTIEGLSQAETAALLGVSEKAVETRLYRARASLQKTLRD